jgi:hypothetical protein
VADLIVLPEADELAAWLLGPGRMIQFLGDAGRGKTARLRRLGLLFPDAHYIYLAEGEPPPALPQPKPAAGAVFVLLDEAQRLPRRRRRHLFRSTARAGASLVLAAHEDVAGEAEAEGLECRTRTVAGLDTEQLLAVIDRRLEWARCPGGQPPRIRRPEAERLIQCYRDDLRSALDHLYEVYQRAVQSGGEGPWRSAI